MILLFQEFCYTEVLWEVFSKKHSIVQKENVFFDTNPDVTL